MRRNHDHFQPVYLLEFVRLGVGRSRHAGELAVHAEVVLKGDRGERLVLALDRDVLLGLDRLVQAVGPAPSRHEPAGKLVDDDHLAVLDHVVPVAKEKVMRPERGVEVVHQVHVRRLVQAAAIGQQACAAEQLLGAFVPFF